MPPARTQMRKATPSKPPVYDEGSRRLAALGLAMLVLLGAPIMSLNQEDPTTGRVKLVHFAPVHVAVLAIQDVTPKLKVVGQVLLLPAAVMMEAGRLLKDCRGADKSLCDFRTLVDIQNLLAKADMEQVLPVFKKTFTPSYLSLLYAGGVVVTLSSLVGLYKPVRTGTLGFFLLLIACYLTPGAGFMPTLIMEGFLSAYVLFYSPEAMNKEAEERAKKDAEKKAKAAKAATSGSSSQPSTQGERSPGAGTPSKRRKPVDRKGLYDI